VEDDLVTTAFCDEFPISTAERALRPPAIFDKPRLAHAVNNATVDGDRAAIVAGAD
jgi:hypothetical protein